jgi:hypothetical protein
VKLCSKIYFSKKTLVNDNLIECILFIALAFGPPTLTFLVSGLFIPRDKYTGLQFGDSLILCLFKQGNIS